VTLNWSEFPPLPGRPVDECSESGYLDALSHAGVKFPLGEYTVKQRGALTMAEIDREASRRHGNPMFPLINAASLKLFGVKLRPVSGDETKRATDAQLRAALTTRGNMVVIPGTFGNLPLNHPLRTRAARANGRDYIGGHMLAFEVDDELGCLDPLQKMSSEPYHWNSDMTRAVADVLLFAYDWSDAHVARAGEFAGLPDTAMEDDVEIVERITGQELAIVANTDFYHDATFGTPYYTSTGSLKIQPFGIVKGQAYKDPPGNTAGTTNDRWYVYVTDEVVSGASVHHFGYLPVINGTLRAIGGSAGQLSAVRNALAAAKTALDGEDQAHVAADAAHDASVAAVQQAIKAAQ
jgi:hypothetical protein